MSGLVETTAGLISKVSNVYANSLEASKDNVIYIFDLMTENTVPVNGRVRINLPDEASMNTAYVQNNCYRLDYAQVPISLDCFADYDGNYFDVVIRSS